MPAAVPIILGITAAMAAGTAVYQGVDAEKKRKEARDAGEAQSAQAQKMQDDLLKEQKAQQDSAAADQAASEKDKAITGSGNAARDASRRRQQSLKAGAGNRQSTILTSPLGDTGQAPTATKTLLGS